VVNRDTLFSYKSSSEKFLFNIMSLFISSHYKNSPNDLQLLSDSPAHLIFALLGPIHRNTDGKVELPDILCAVQLALEGNLTGLAINENAQRGIKPSGDLIPWNIREQFQDNEFPKLAGARIVRIATHSKAVKMGYGTRALEQLALFF
jgi:N-acetyltransferase 10